MTMGIYKITHINTGRIYIGQSVNIEHRWHVHGAAKSQCVKIRNAIQYYGRHEFSLTILEVVHDRTMLSEREQYYLDTLQPFGDKGFNICTNANAGPGLAGVPKTGICAAGVTNKNNRPVCAYDQLGNLIGEFYSVRYAAQVLHIDKSGIHACLTGRYRSAGGFFWADKGQQPTFRDKKTSAGRKDTPEVIEAKRIRAREQIARRGGLHAPNKKAVVAVDANNHIVHTFNQIKLAAQGMNVSSTAILNSIKRGYKCCGLQWHYIGNL